ncbi:MAG: hypothetical protein ACXACD_21840 [Candidatus Thorarchaeota archaeon]
MAYLTWRSYVRSGPVCLGALLVIGGAIIALLPSIDPAYAFFGEMTVLIGAGVAVLGDSVLAPVDTRVDDTPPPPPPPD